MRTLLIVFHSMTGGTRAMAEAAAEGARREADVSTALREARETGPEDLLTADAAIFATPENLGTMAGMMKDFFDRTYYPALGRIEGRAYAQMICAGSDGTGAARQIERIATGWRLRVVAPPIIVCTHAQTPDAILAPKAIGAAELERCRELGATLAAGLTMGLY